MKYTEEQLSKMSDFEVNKALVKATGHSLLESHPHNADKTSVCCDLESYNGTWIDFCSSWSATGPLMVEYVVALQFENGAYDHAFDSNDGVTTKTSCNKNPLRAICEVILMIGGEK